MSVSVERQAILMSLQPLFEEAEARGLWFFHESNEAGQVWCSPEYLRLRQAEGELIWAPEHWQLRSPFDYMDGLKGQAEALVAEYNDLVRRFGHGENLEFGVVAGAAAEDKKQ